MNRTVAADNWLSPLYGPAPAACNAPSRTNNIQPAYNQHTINKESSRSQNDQGCAGVNKLCVFLEDKAQLIAEGVNVFKIVWYDDSFWRLGRNHRVYSNLVLYTNDENTHVTHSLLHA